MSFREFKLCESPFWGIDFEDWLSYPVMKLFDIKTTWPTNIWHIFLSWITGYYYVLKSRKLLRAISKQKQLSVDAKLMSCFRVWTSLL